MRRLTELPRADIIANDSHLQLDPDQTELEILRASVRYGRPLRRFATLKISQWLEYRLQASGVRGWVEFL